MIRSILRVECLLEIVNGELNALVQCYGRPPMNELDRPVDARTTLLRIVHKLRQEHDLGFGLQMVSDLLGEVDDREFVRITQIHRLANVRVHQRDQSGHQIANVLKRSRLLTITVDGDRLVSKCLRYEIAHNSPVQNVHSRTVSVEDSGHRDPDVLLLRVRVGQRLGHSLALVIARPRSHCVYVPKINFTLRML